MAKAPVATPPPPPPPATPPPAVPPYPPPVKAADFTDKPPDGKPLDLDSVHWSLQMVMLEDLTGDSGVRERLHNLGYPVLGLPDGPELSRMIKAYQKARMNQDNGSGKLADIKGHVINLHDNP